MLGFSRLRILDARLLLGVIAVALITVSKLSNREPVQKLAPSQVSRGELRARIWSFALSPTTAQIATTNDAGRVTLRAPETGWRIERFLDFPGYAKVVAFSPDGRFLAAAGNGPGMLSPDGEFLPAAGTAPGICLWDLRSPGNERAETISIPIQQVNRMMFSPDGQSLVLTADLDRTILLWDLATRRERMVLRHPSTVESIAFSPDGRGLATAGGRDDGSICLWDLQTGSRRTLPEDGPCHTVAIAFSPDGTLLASAGFPEHHVRLWDVKTGRVCRVFSGHTRPVTSVAFSPDGSLLATAGNDGTLGLWTVATGQRRVSLDGQAVWPHTVAFSADGRTVALATGDDDDVRLWDLAELLRAPN